MSEDIPRFFPAGSDKLKYSSSSDNDSDTEEYKCEPGMCVIINNMAFSGKDNLQAQGEKDENNLRLLFTMLGFTVKVHRDLTAAQMDGEVRFYSQMEHQGAFVLVILSHGDVNDEVYGIDDESVTVFQLESYFHDSHPTLRGVPKIFFIDACRGDKNDYYHKRLRPKRLEPKKTPDSVETVTTNTETADIAIIYASARNRLAFGDDENGSVFTQNFTSEILKAEENDHLYDILLRVRRKVLTHPDAKPKERQTPVELNRLTKHYYIKRDTDLAKLQLCYKQYSKVIHTWIPLRETTIQNLESLKRELKQLNTKGNIGKGLGGAAVVGGAAVAVGLGAIGMIINPGVGLFFMASGATMAAGGGVAIAAANKIKKLRGSEIVKKAQVEYDNDQSQLQEIIKQANQVQNIVDRIKTRFPNMPFDTFEIFINRSVARERERTLINDNSITIGSLTLSMTAVQSKAFISGMSTTTMLNPFNITGTIQSADKNEIEKFERVINDLQKQKEAIKKDLSSS